jgi:hypothetical protein
LLRIRKRDTTLTIPDRNDGGNLSFVLESPQIMIAGEAFAFTAEYLGAISASSPSSTIYIGESDSSASLMISGDSDSVSGSSPFIQTAKKVTARLTDAGQKYVLVFQCTIDNNIQITRLQIDVVSPGQEL